MNKLIFFIMALLLQGCASLLSNSAYPVLIESKPAGADFVINNQNGVEIGRGVTPSTVILESGAGYFRRGSYTVHFSKWGFEPQDYSLVSRMNGWYWANIPNPIGMLLVDPATGAMWRLPLRLFALLPEKRLSTSRFK